MNTFWMHCTLGFLCQIFQNQCYSGKSKKYTVKKDCRDFFSFECCSKKKKFSGVCVWSWVMVTLFLVWDVTVKSFKHIFSVLWASQRKCHSLQLYWAGGGNLRSKNQTTIMWDKTFFIWVNWLLITIFSPLNCYCNHY